MTCNSCGGLSRKCYTCGKTGRCDCMLGKNNFNTKNLRCTNCDKDMGDKYSRDKTNSFDDVHQETTIFCSKQCLMEHQ